MGRTDMRSSGAAWLLALAALALAALGQAACSDSKEAESGEAAAAGSTAEAGAQASQRGRAAALQVQRPAPATADIPYNCPAAVAAVAPRCSPAAPPEAGTDWVTSCPEGLQPDARCQRVGLNEPPMTRSPPPAP